MIHHDSTLTCLFMLQLLQGHVVPEVAMAADLSNNQMLTTLAGSDLTVMLSGGEVMIMAPMGGETATVTDADQEAGAGVVHVIDAVLVPGDGAPSMAPMMGPAPGPGPDMAPAPGAPGSAPGSAPGAAPSSARSLSVGLAGIGTLAALVLAL